MRRASVVIADRHPVVLRGLSSALRDHSDFNIVARCSDGASCVEALRKFAPDIAILDASMSDVTWQNILSIINSEGLPTRPVVFTASDQELARVMMATAANGHSVISKEVTPEVLVQSLRQIAAGRQLLPSPSLSPSSERAAAREQGTIAENALAGLTEREQQIMLLVSEGLSNKEIGRRLDITDGTIKVHLHHIFQKLEISNRTMLAALAISLNERGIPSEDKPEGLIWSD
jgi:two-component system nitrate/nitrite response regulator NarL